MKIATRISLGIFVIICGGIYYLVDWMISDIRPRYLESLEEPMVDFAHLLAAQIEQDIEGELPDLSSLALAFDSAYTRRFSAQIYQLHKSSVTLRAYVTDERGIVVFDSEGRDVGRDYSQWRDVHLTLRGGYGARSTRTDEADPATSTLYVAAPIVNRVGRIIGVVSIAKPTSTIMLFVSTARAKVITVGVVCGITILALSILMLLWVTKPIATLTEYARQVRDNRKVSLPPLGRASDITALGSAFEEMRDTLEGKNYIESYVQTLTHEIKSPLSSIKGATELLAEEMPADRRARFLATIQKESTRIEHLVERLLQLSALEARKGLTKVERIKLASLVDDVLDSLSASLLHKGIKVHRDLSAAPDCIVSGDRFLLFTACINLLQNAIDFTTERGLIHVSINCPAKHAELRVRNSGGHIPDYALDKIFDRFYSLPRPQSERRGTGLGLPFVKEVALLHEGRIEVRNAGNDEVEAILSLPR